MNASSAGHEYEPPSDSTTLMIASAGAERANQRFEDRRTRRNAGLVDRIGEIGLDRNARIRRNDAIASRAIPARSRSRDRCRCRSSISRLCAFQAAARCFAMRRQHANETTRHCGEPSRRARYSRGRIRARDATWRDAHRHPSRCSAGLSRASNPAAISGKSHPTPFRCRSRHRV